MGRFNCRFCKELAELVENFVNMWGKLGGLGGKGAEKPFLGTDRSFIGVLAVAI